MSTAKLQRLQRRRLRLLDRQDRLYRLLMGSRAAVLPTKRLNAFFEVSRDLEDLNQQIAHLTAQLASCNPPRG
ncbi:hypothetical protein [Deinococcus pimensis]|uniref:hypothetical protein n=1 Tax=Deinococcus pimensis TaxID=309888 RepID=UPI00146F9D59|nr:hypothetical protein [Deinococcus pimensis]